MKYNIILAYMESFLYENMDCFKERKIAEVLRKKD